MIINDTIHDLRNESPFCDLNDEDFKLFASTHEIGDEMGIDDHDCECETYIIGEGHRCSCGNRRCTIIRDSYDGRSFFIIEVY